LFETTVADEVVALVEPAVADDAAGLVDSNDNDAVVSSVDQVVSDEVAELAEPSATDAVLESIEPPALDEVTALVEPIASGETAELVEPGIADEAVALISTDEVLSSAESPDSDEVVALAAPSVSQDAATVAETEENNSVLPEQAEADTGEPIVVASAAAIGSANLNLENEEPAEALVPSEQDAEPTLSSLRRTALFQMNVRSKRIKFVAGEVVLTSASEPLLEQIFEDLFLYSESDIIIEVANQDSTDSVGNEALATERAAFLQTFLVDRGLEEERLLLSILPESEVPDENQHISIEAKINE